MDQNEKIARGLNIRSAQVAAVVELLNGGNTIPFIARYRKEVTGTLDEEQIRQIADLDEKYRTLENRREAVLASIESQEKMTPELKEKLLQAETITALEDLYLPYKPKRKTRATVAKEKGLQGLADLILKQQRSSQTLAEMIKPFLNEAVATEEEALSGARDIIAETISDNADIRQYAREKASQWGTLKSEKIESAEDEKSVYQLYYNYECRVDRLRPHQVLAINRGESEKILKVKIEVGERDWRFAIGRYFYSRPGSPWAEQLNLAIDEAAQRLLLPAIERDVRRILSEQADMHAINVFASNLKALLSQPPLAGYVVMGVDPAYRTGCKIAVTDETGKLLETTTIYPNAPQNRWEESKEQLQKLIKKHHVTLVSIGNGTASRETELLIAETIKGFKDVHYLITNEAGASVYSASPLARAEFPDLDVSIRGAISIGRRVQDPLAELVKIDPKSIGVGLYQHDVDQKELSETLDAVVESVVNQVGVDVNTASPALLTHVSGIGPKLADSIVSYRNENGQFINRKQLMKVPGLGAKAFEQSAGFLRVRNGDSPLDTSAIHPESYPVAERVLNRIGIPITASIEEKQDALDKIRSEKPLAVLAEELGTGVPTLEDILEQLIRPGRDPRQDVPAPLLRSDVLSMKDLLPGMRLKGTVRNVVDFGAFVDIGVKQDGLLHRSQIPSGTLLGVGDIIDVEISAIDEERGRIGLKFSEES